MREEPIHPDDPSFNPSHEFNRESRNTTRESIEGLDPGKTPSRIAEKIFQNIKTYLGKIGNEFTPGKDAHSNFIEHSEKLGLSKDDSNKAASALSKLNGSKSGLPFGFNKDGELTDPIKYKNGGIDFDTFLNQDFDSKAIGIKEKLKNDYGITDELSALKEYLNKASAKFRENAKIDLPNDIKQAMKDISSNDPKKKEEARSKLKDFFGGDEYNNIVQDNEDRLARNEELNSKEGSGNPKSNYKVILALIFLLEFGSALGYLAYLLQQYAGAHTGCMKFEYNSSTNSYINSTKVFCDNDTKDSFPPLMCYCAKDNNDHKSTLTCNKHNTSAYEPAPNQTPTYPDCKGGETSIDNYLYYSYQVMDPASAGLDIAQKAAGVVGKGISDLLKMIIHAAIVIGIILGVLLVLWIIYKVVANRKPAETLKIETSSGPSTVTKFGNRGYLGNLSKYSNYAYMGRCVAQPARPYIPPRFKF